MEKDNKDKVYDNDSTTINDVSEKLTESKVINFIKEKVQNIKLTMKYRKELASKLNIEERRALQWKTVSDIFSCIDTYTLAKEAPEEAGKIVKTVLTIVTIFAPVVAPISIFVAAMPNKQAGTLIKYFGIPTPEHVVKKIADNKSKEAIEINDSMESETIDVECEVKDIEK